MFTMAKVKDDNTTGNDFMFDHLSCNDYYSENEKIEGHWYGLLAEKFGVSGKIIIADEFAKIQKNKNPWIGDKLTPSVRRGSSRFFDFQCSAQKSISIMAVVMNDYRLTEVHNECVKAALAEMEKFVSCRIRKGIFRNSEQLENTGNFLAGLYNHNASRALDPQLHTHCVVANVTWCESEKCYKALSEYEILKAIRYCGKFYQSSMARRVQELGYEIELKRTEKGIEGFEIKGIDKSILEKYSRRRAEIENKINDFLTEAGREPTPAEIHVIAKETREAKLTEITTPEVLELQRNMLSAEEFVTLRSIKHNALDNNQILEPRKSAQIIKILGKTIDHLFERNSVQTGYQLLAEALNLGLKNINVEDLKQALKNNKELIQLIDSQDILQSYFITKRGLALEQEAIKMANSGIEKYQGFGTIPDLGKLLKSQQQAVQEILTCKDFACILRGYAGSGKTTALRPIYQSLKESGQNTLFLAPTRNAVKVLQKDGFKSANTVSAFFQEPILPEKSVLIVDESSLVSAATGHKLMYLAKQNNARIIFVGDRRQHLSVEAGDFLKVLELYGDIKTFKLSRIIRQLPEEYRYAVQLMANNKAATGLELLHELGAIQEKSHHYLSAAAQSYVDNILTGKNCLLVSPTHKEIDTLNTLVRKQLARNGVLNFNHEVNRTCFQDHNWTREQIANFKTYKSGYSIRFNTPLFGTRYQKHDILTIAKIENGNLIFTNGDSLSSSQLKNKISVGKVKTLPLAPDDKILITANKPSHNLTNGDIGTIKSIHSDGTIILTDDRIIPNNFESISYGYATTSHKSQGTTCDHVILAAAQIVNRACYVGSSRARHTIQVFTPDFKHLYSGVEKNSEHLIGHDLVIKKC